MSCTAPPSRSGLTLQAIAELSICRKLLHPQRDRYPGAAVYLGHRNIQNTTRRRIGPRAFGGTRGTNAANSTPRAGELDSS